PPLASGAGAPPSAHTPTPRPATPPVAPPLRPAATPMTAPAPVQSSPAPAVPRPPITPPGSSPALGDATSRRPLNPFLSKDPNQRAKRLARALVSDIITYHPAKHAEGLRDG